MIPIVKIRWDEAVNPPPKYQVIRYRKLLPTEKVDLLPLVDSGQPNYTFTDNSITVANEALYYNKIWIYRVISKCSDGSLTKFGFAEFIKFSCNLNFTANAYPTVIDCIFYHMGGDINKYLIKLYNEAGTKLSEISRTAPFTSSGGKITGSFVGLSPDTLYTIIVTPMITGTAYEGECEFEKRTTLANNNWSLEHTNNTPITRLRLYVGNNATTPTTLLYDAPYTGSPTILTGTHSSGFVNANFKLIVDHGDTVSGGTINGAAGSVVDAPPVTTINWSGVSTNAVIKFTTNPAVVSVTTDPCFNATTAYLLTSNVGNVIELELSYSAGGMGAGHADGAGVSGTISSGATSTSMASTHYYGVTSVYASINPRITIVMSGISVVVNTTAYLNNVSSVSYNSAVLRIISVNGILQANTSTNNVTGCAYTSGGDW